MNVRVGAKTDVGRARERNEDSYLIREPLFAVADGIGGHRGGNVASSLTVEAIGGMDLPQEGGLGRLIEEIKRANRIVLERGEGDRDLQGMGTTLTALLAEDEKAHIAHIGDSRAYLLREGSLQQLTEDHTLVRRMVKEGKLAPEDAERHPQRNILTRSLGVEGDISVDELTLQILPGDRLLVCTDGLTSMVEDGTIRRILADENDPQRACDRLVEEANEAGGDDNITVIVVDFLEGDEARPAATVAASGAAASEGGRATVSAETPGRVAESTPRERGEAVTGAVTTGPPGSEPARRPRRRIRWARVGVWAAAVLVLAAAAFVGVRMYVDGQWYVGESNGRVAIYHGIPTEVLGYELSRVDEVTDISATEAERLQPWRELSDGITANSLEDARRLVSQIRRDVAEAGRSGSR